MPATVIAERIGWRRGMTVLTARVRELRPVYEPPDPASRTSYVAGEIAQHDFWFPDITLPVGFGQTRTAKQLPVLTMVTGYSRMLFARLVPTRHAEDLYCGWWRHLTRLDAVPRVLVWDGEGAVGVYGGGRNKLTAECQAFRGTLGATVLVLRPRDPEAKGIIERAHDYLERAFLPGRTFTGPDDFNRQLQGWLDVVNQRRRRVLGLRPDRTDHRRHRSDAAAATGLSGDRVADRWTAAPRLLRAVGQQRLLRPPLGDRPPDRGRCRPGPGPGLLRRQDRRRSCSGLGQTPIPHPARARRGSQAAAARPDRSDPPSRRARGPNPLPGRLRPCSRPRPWRTTIATKTGRSPDAHHDTGP